MDGASARTGTVDDEDDGDLMVQRSWKWDWEGGHLEFEGVGL